MSKLLFSIIVSNLHLPNVWQCINTRSHSISDNFEPHDIFQGNQSHALVALVTLFFSLWLQITQTSLYLISSFLAEKCSVSLFGNQETCYPFISYHTILTIFSACTETGLGENAVNSPTVATVPIWQCNMLLVNTGENCALEMIFAFSDVV